ncbi:recombinase family protein, partial [Streptomyces sp. NPDC002928]|uniref:recombinase family protein n=1 Tax=Streptomyces sp. NPDC002928 TaxID=3154440 RepID=UPI0033A20593
MRVWGTSGQESSLAAQEAELRASASGVVVAVFKDRASGLRESRPGLDRLLKRAAAGEFTHVRVTHGDRLARFGAGWLTQVLAHHHVTVEV